MSSYVCASPDEQYTQEERRNRDLVLEFYDAAVNRRDPAAAARHLGDRYTEHNPRACDGADGFRDFMADIGQRFPKFRVEVKRVFVEGDLVALHVRSYDGPTANGEAGVDIFRLQAGRIVEHWNVIQPIPDSLPHANTMF